MSKRAPSENRAPSNRPAKRGAAKAGLDELLAAAGASRQPGEGGGWAIADAFRFRQQITREAEADGFKEELLAALSDECFDPARLVALLRPTAGAAAVSSNDSIVRLLLHVDSLQPDIASSLMQLLPEYQGEEASDAMTTTRLILSQFRWLEHIVDGAALVGAASEMMQARARARAQPGRAPGETPRARALLWPLASPPPLAPRPSPPRRVRLAAAAAQPPLQKPPPPRLPSPLPLSPPPHTPPPPSPSPPAASPPPPSPPPALPFALAHATSLPHLAPPRHRWQTRL